MKLNARTLLRLFSIGAIISSSAGAIVTLAQKKTVNACRQSTFAALKQLPETRIRSPEGRTDSDDKILKSPPRVAALKGLTKEFESFTDLAWWQANVDELNAASYTVSRVRLTDEEKGKLRDGDYEYRLGGNHNMRLLITYDPCYQAGYSGSVISLLY